MSFIRRLSIRISLAFLFLLFSVCQATNAKENKPSSCSLIIENKVLQCSFGRSGLTTNKREGDGATPIGDFHLRKIFYRKDRVKRNELPADFSVRSIHKNDGWCDDPTSPYYNRFVKLPFNGSHEKLWRKDHVYDIVVVVGYNDNPPKKGKGSAIFLHIARENYAPTAGCIALSRKDLLLLLKKINPSSILHIEPKSITIKEKGYSQ